MSDSHIQTPSGLETPNRYITENNASGLAVFNTSIPSVLPTQIAGNLALHLAYATTSFPTDFSTQADVTTYSNFLSTPPGIFVAGGTVLRVVDMQPGEETPLHRTDSLDYGVVLEGDVELVLDGGESKVLKRGDITIQRGTNHLWRNRSKTEWSRMMFVSLDAKPVERIGKN